MTYPSASPIQHGPHRDIDAACALAALAHRHEPHLRLDCAPSSGEIILENRDRAASPELDLQDLYAPGTAVTIECQYAGWQTLFAGLIAHVMPDMGDRGARRVVVTLEGPEAALSRVPAALPLMANLRAGEIIGRYRSAAADAIR